MSLRVHPLPDPVERLIPVRSKSPQLREALDELLRPAARLPPAPKFLILRLARIDWTAVGAAGYIYALAFTVWLYLVR